MYQRILVTLDGSPFSEAVLPEVHTLVKGSQLEIILLMVQDEPHAMGDPVVAADERLIMLGTAPAIVLEGESIHHETKEQAFARAKEQAEHYLERHAAPLRNAGHQVTTTVLFGQAPEIIIQVARKEAADAIMMATHGRAGLSRLIAGSVASQVVAQSGKPVVLIRPTENP